MKKLIGQDIGTYVFDKTAKTVKFAGISGLVLENILLITNVTAHVIIYNFADAATTATLASLPDGTFLLTLAYDTSSMNNGDKLQIYVDMPASDVSVLPANPTPTLRDTELILRALVALGSSLPTLDNPTPTLDVNLEKVFGSQRLIDEAGRISTISVGSQKQPLQQRAATLEQITFDAGMNVTMPQLLALFQALVTAVMTNAANANRLRVQLDLSDYQLRVQEYQHLTARLAEWDALISQDKLLNLMQSVNGGGQGYSLALGLSGSSYYLMEEVR